MALLGKLRGIESVDPLLKELRDSYIEHITDKLKAISRWSANRGANIIVFPEYSVPIEALLEIRSIAKNSGIIIVAGTHRVMFSQYSRTIYSDLGLDMTTIVNGSAIAPVIFPNGTVRTAPKRAQSKWEPNLTVAEGETPVFNTQFDNETVSFVVTPCIDSLRLDSFEFLKSMGDTPHMVFCPSLSPETSMFEDMGKVLSSNETFFAVVNSAAYGGTCFNIPKAWQPSISGVAPIYQVLPRDYEAIFEIDLESNAYFMKKGTVLSTAPCRHPRIFPITYLKENEWIDEYEEIKKDTLDLLDNGSQEDATEWIDENLSRQEVSLPDTIVSQLKDCRHKYLALYSGDRTGVEDALTLVTLQDEISDTRDLFAKRIDQTLEIITKSFRDLPEVPSKELLECMKAFKTIQVRIGPPQPSKQGSTEESLDDKIGKHSYLPADSTIAGFQDRGPKLEQLREIIVTGSERVIVITGMAGIGKTEIVNTLFLKVLTDWRPIWINIGTDTSVARLISELGSIVGITMDVDSLGSATDDIFRKQVNKVSASIFSTEKNVIVIDDLKNLIPDHKNYSHLQILIEALSTTEKYKGSRVFLLSSVSAPPLWMQKANIARIPIRGLDDVFIRRVIEFQLREAGLIPGEEAADIPQSLLEMIDGHPLAARIAAIASEKNGLYDLSHEIIASEVETNIIALCLPRIELSPDELFVARSVSMFRQPVDLKTLAENMVLDETVLVTLASKAVVVYDGHYYSMHPLIRKYYYTDIPDVDKKTFHKKAANCYAKVARRDHLGHFTNPTFAFELAYHLTLAGDFRELFDLRLGIFEEMYPAARLLYSQRQYDKALELFSKIAEVRPQEASVWAYIGRCHARRSQWKDCDQSFEKAIEVATRQKQQASWIHRDWGQIRARFGFFTEAKPHIADARNLSKGDDASSISCEAYIQWKSGDIPAATDLFEQVLHNNPQHHYSLNTYIRMLEETGGRVEYIEELKTRLSDVRNEMIEPDFYEIDHDPENEI